MSLIGVKYRGTRECHRVMCRLISAAEREEEVLYSDIASILGIAASGHHMAREVGQVLGEISEDEVNAGRPMLSAIAVSVSGVPGPGFFKLARQFGRLNLDPADTAGEVDFWMAEERRVYDAWRPKVAGGKAYTGTPPISTK